MRTEASSQSRRVVAISSQHTVTLAMDWPQPETANLLGFAIRRHNPDVTVLWLEELLSFNGQAHEPGAPFTTNKGPVQKMFWADYTVRPGLQYTYQIIPGGRGGRPVARTMNPIPNLQENEVPGSFGNGEKE